MFTQITGPYKHDFVDLPIQTETHAPVRGQPVLHEPRRTSRCHRDDGSVLGKTEPSLKPVGCADGCVTLA